MLKLSKKTILLSQQTADYAWNLVQFWGIFSQNLIGRNFLLALDSLSIDLKHFQDPKIINKNNLIYNAYKNCQTGLLWLDKARRRQVINNDDYQNLYTNLTTIAKILEKNI